MAPPIFISHVSEDRKAAEAICAALEGRNLTCWVAFRDVEPGEDFQRAIVRAIRAAKVMVLIFSERTNSSIEIPNEMVLAGRSNVPIVPLRIEDVEPDDALAYALATRQRIDLFADRDRAIELLVRRVNQVIGLGVIDRGAVATGVTEPGVTAPAMIAPVPLSSGQVEMAVIPPTTLGADPPPLTADDVSAVEAGPVTQTPVQLVAPSPWIVDQPTRQAAVDDAGLGDRKPHPWRRCLARYLDYLVIEALLYGGLLLFMPQGGPIRDTINADKYGLLVTLTAALLFIPIEATLLFHFGTTLGKLLHNIRIGPVPGGKQTSFSGLFARSIQAWFFGVGCALPLISLVTEINSYKALKRDGVTRWDRMAPWRVRCAAMTWWRWVLVGVAWTLAVCAFAALVGIALSDTSGRLAQSSPTPTAALPTSPPVRSAQNEQLTATEMNSQGTAAYNKKNYAEALTWYRKAADQGLAAAQFNLATLYQKGGGVAVDDAQALTWYRKAADQGLAAAQYNLGLMYQDGQGVAPDYAQALTWYRKAADQGLAVAQVRIGLLYQKGQGVAVDDAQALAWYRKAADQGLAAAQYNIGLMYANGLGVAVDSAQALTWYRKAADQGLATAQENLGALYQTGQGVAVDYAQALTWYRKAADQGLAGAQFNIGLIYANGLGVAVDYAQALTWYRKAADQGLAVAQENLGALYQTGQGVAVDYAQALTWYRKAADQGVAGAQYNIGLIYANGLGVPNNPRLAREWMTKAASGGYQAAKTWLQSH